MANRDLKSVVYTSDLGVNFATKIDAAVFAQAGASTDPKVGGADYDGDPELHALPDNLIPRHVLMVSAGGNVRKVICLAPDSDLYTGVETTLNLQVLGGAAVAYTRFGRSAERPKTRHNPAQ